MIKIHYETENLINPFLGENKVDKYKTIMSI
jgi:hypothetical protein